MKDIFELLKGLGIEIEADKKDAFNKEFTNNYKTIAEFEKQSAKLKTTEESLTTLKTEKTELEKTINDYKGTDEDVKQLKDKVAQYEQAEKDRLEKIKQEKDEQVLTTTILENIKDKEFVNDFTKNAIINDIKTKLKDDNYKGKGVKEIFEEITKDSDGILKNPQDPMKIPSGNVEKNIVDENKAREIMGLPPLK